MGDRAYVELFCRPQDRTTFEKLGFVFQNLTEAGCMMVMEEGYADDLPGNVPYYGHHGHGSEYDAHAFACNGRKRYDVRCSGSGCTILVECPGPNGPAARDLQHVARYWKALERASALVRKAALSDAAPLTT